MRYFVIAARKVEKVALLKCPPAPPPLMSVCTVEVGVDEGGDTRGLTRNSSRNLQPSWAVKAASRGMTSVGAKAARGQGGWEMG